MKGTITMAAILWGVSAMAAEAEPQTGTWAIRPIVEIESFAGQKHLSRGSFRALDEQVEGGVRATVSRRDSDPIALTVGYLESRASRRDAEYEIAAMTRETGLGLRTRIRSGHLEATASAGVAMLETRLAAAYALNTWEKEERGIGVWYGIGIRVPIGRRVTTGIEVRQTIGRDGTARANGFHVGGTLAVRLGRGRS